jgi:hypothetical protein
MSTLVVPPLDGEPWPTLGRQVCDFIEEYGRYGPGELKGERYKITTDFRGFLYRAYEVYPRGHRLAGRRRFKRCYDEERKGTAKTEKAMLVAIAESHPEAPVRCDGFDAKGRPVGVGVRSPYIPLVSYTVEQTEDLGFNVLRAILEESPLGADYDVGLERIVLLDTKGREAGKIVPLAGSPAARDGARTTFQHFDEPHRMTLPRLIKAHSTMVENTYKRVGADAWGLYTSTAGDPNEESVARDMRTYAEQIQRGEVEDPRLFFFSRAAPLDMPTETPDDVRAFLLEASGPNAEWSGDIDALVSRWFEPKTDKQYFRRVWGNQWVPGGQHAFDARRWADLARDEPTEPGTLIVLGFSGSRWSQAGLVATDVVNGRQFVVGEWTAPDGGSILETDVDAVVRAAFDCWSVWRMYVNPPPWEGAIDGWRGLFGEKVVRDWPINRPRQMATACRLFATAIAEGDLRHDGNAALASHIEHCIRHPEPYEDDDGEPLWTIRRGDATHEISLAASAVLSWEARGDAIAAGATVPPDEAIIW